MYNFYFNQIVYYKHIILIILAKIDNNKLGLMGDE